MGPAYERMGAERGQHDPWTDELVAEVTAARRAELDLADWGARVAWRDRVLMALLRARTEPVPRPAMRAGERASQSPPSPSTAGPSRRGAARRWRQRWPPMG